MFFLLLMGLLIAATVHIVRLEPRTRERAGEVLLLWVLVGYCGLPMLGVSALVLSRPETVASTLGFPAGNPFQTFLGWSYLGMSIIATLALRFRGTYLIAPAVAWSVFFAGATFIHLGEAHGAGGITHAHALVIFGSHGLVTVVLLGGLAASRLLAGGPGVSRGALRGR